MKNTFRFTIATLAATAVLAGCVQEITPPSSDSKPATPLTEGSRVIAVSFGEQTKTTLGSGLQPQFEDGDWITVSNNEASEYRQVSVDDNGKATFSTDLEGLLKAVYPKEAAEVGNDTIVGIKVPAKQDGSFANANICMAEMKDEKGESLTFENKTALFIVTPPQGVETFTVRSLNTIDKTLGQRSSEANAAFINTDGATEDAKRVINVTAIDSDGKAYVAIAAPATGAVNLSDLSFEAEKGISSGWIKGIAPNDIKARATALSKSYEAFNTVAVGTAYTLESGWHEYVTVAGEKWATMNVGATESNIYGAHFTCGGVVGQEADFSAEPGPSGEPPMAFSENFVTPPSIVGDIVTLPLEYDAAYANWGGGWRMPSGGNYGEYKAFFENTDSSWETVDGVPGRVFTDNKEPGNKLFFPAAGGGQGTYLFFANLQGYYWSSSLVPGYTDNAYYLMCAENNVSPLFSMTRNSGLTVRPIYDPTPAPEEPLHDILPGVFTVSDNGTPEYKSDDVKVKFSLGNLYCSRPSADSDDWSWHFFDSQYECIPIPHDTVPVGMDLRPAPAETDLMISLFTWGYDAEKSVNPVGTDYVTAHTTDGDTTLVSENGGDDWGVAYRESNRRTLGNWRTLTSDEWKFLFNYNPSRYGQSGHNYDNDIRRGKVKVNVTVCGLPHCIVILPDDWDEEFLSLDAFASTLSYSYDNVEGTPSWNDMADAGAVCIPLTCMRQEGNRITKVTYGSYWTSTAAENNEAYYLETSGAFEKASRSTGYSVRLVTECK